jgi:perosamine synthetase
MPLHMHPYYRETYGYKPADLPTAASLYPEIITLPLYPDLTEADVDYVCTALTEIITQNLAGRRATSAAPRKKQRGKREAK